MSKWKCDICKKEFDNFHAQGFDNKIYCPLCFFKEENKRLQQRIDKALQELDKYRINFDFPGFTDKTIENTRKILRGGNDE